MSRSAKQSVAVLAAMFAVLAGAAPAGATTFTFSPTADARVRSNAPDTNYGSLGYLVTNGCSCDAQESFLRFSVSGLDGPVASAVLRGHSYDSVDGPTADGPAVYPTSGSWTEGGITWSNRPSSTGPALFDAGAVGRNVDFDMPVTAAVAGNGSYNFLLRQPTGDGLYFDSREFASASAKPRLIVTTGSPAPTPTPTSTPTATPTPTPTATPTPSDPVVAIAGDIADDGSGDTGTARVVQAINPDRVLTAGDNAYPDGTLSNYQSWYDPTWGAFKAKTRPIPGNHDYHTSGASGYFDYFNGIGVNSGPAGPRAQGYYSFDLGSWHLIALNNYVSMSSGSAQETWLKSDLAAHPGQCTLAYWHEPRFTSGAEHANNTSVTPLWNDLYAAGADVIVNGHNHQYERFARQNPQGQLDTIKGLREFVAGAGGAGLYPFGTVQPNSEVRDSTTHGVLRLTLHPGSYDWSFRPSDGTFTDAGTAGC